MSKEQPSAKPIREFTGNYTVKVDSRGGTVSLEVATFSPFRTTHWEIVGLQEFPQTIRNSVLAYAAIQKHLSASFLWTAMKAVVSREPDITTKQLNLSAELPDREPISA